MLRQSHSRSLIYILATAFWVATVVTPTWADSADDNPLASIPLRHIGPAINSGRISEFAFHPEHKQVFYVATASGNLWKTSNNTITWEPIFDSEGSYALGTIKLDPNDPLTLWVGTGENNSQRSVAYGDGVYKSTDGGKSWTNMGLADSGHISQIWINPANSDHVLVASQGPLWNDGGDRGLYRSLDGGDSWERILQIDPHTGINEFVVDPDNPDNIVASSYQRRRHVWVLINGGPGSGIHRTTDGGASWSEVTSGLPGSNMGRIGLAMAPSATNTLYAIIEANDKDKGVYRSLDFGQTWHKQSSYMTNSPQYYNELVIDPHNPNRLYSLNTFTQISEDAGKTFSPLSLDHRHVDDHALWIDPDNTDHLYIGGDGGIYETWDRGRTWRHVRNLSIMQFYRIQPDNAEPFYNVCGGTQDNNSLCGPSRTPVVHGIANADWTTVLGGDGYKPQIDPNDPDLIYAQYQYGGLARYDRRTSERIYITPHPGSGENAYKWNWNTPLLISPHASTRLYYAAERVFQSDDRGDSWTAISPDLTRQLDRNSLEVMGRVWSVDSISKNRSTSMYGSIIGLTESPLEEGLIYVGTDDGLISVTEDGGKNWTTTGKFQGVPEMSYVEDVIASQHDANVAYAVVDNHKRGDYKPYVLKSTDRGRSWKQITGNLPERGSAHTIAEDHIDPGLLFVGTEFGLFVTQNGGESWSQMKAGFPTISVRDIEIQRRENDLVVGTFGRGIYILDDYSPLRTPAASLSADEATLFGVRDAWLYIQGDRWEDRPKGSMGSAFFTADNPPFGAVFSYHLKDKIKSERDTRLATEADLEKNGEDTPYPDWEDLRREDHEEVPAVWLEIRDSEDRVVRRIEGSNNPGFQRIAWDMRLPAPDPVNLSPPDFVPYWVTPPTGPLALPGEYSVTLMKRQQGQLETLAGPERFTLKALDRSPEITNDREALLAFHQHAADLKRTVSGASAKRSELSNRIRHLKAALSRTTRANESHEQQLRDIERRLTELNRLLSGDRTIASRSEPTPWSVTSRINSIYGGILESQWQVPQNYRDSMAVAEKELTQVLSAMASVETDLTRLETELDELGAPWTPGRSVPEG